MRFLEFKSLLEYDRSKTIAVAGAGIISAAQRDSYLKSQGLDQQGLVDAVITRAEETDPTDNKIYVQWIIRQFVKQGLNFQDIGKLKDDLDMFNQSKGQHKRLGINSDINSYNWKTLADISTKLSSTAVADVKSADTTTVTDANILYNGPLGMLSHPTTEKSSCELGAGTEWCTAATKSENKFDEYNANGNLYIWHDKKKKKKFQFHFESGQFMDQHDDNINFEDAKYLLKDHPVTSKFFNSNSNILEEVLENYRIHHTPDFDPDDLDYDYEDNSEAEELASDASLDFLVASLAYTGSSSSSKGLVAYYKLNNDDINKSIKRLLEFDPSLRAGFEKLYIKNPSMALKYIQFFYPNQPVPHLEDLLATNGRSAYLYSYHNLNKQRFPAGEPAIVKDAWAATQYVKNTLKKPWPAAEPAIKPYPANWKEYTQAAGIDQ